MRDKKRGFRKEEKNFFRRKLVLDSLRSRVAFVFVVFMFVGVIVLGVMEIYDVEKRFEEVKLSPKANLGNVNINNISNVVERLNGCV